MTTATAERLADEELAKPVTITLPSSDWSAALKRCRHAICKEQTRYYLCGVLLRHDGERLHFVSTDGHRLVEVTTHGDGWDGTPFHRLILPVKFVDQIIKATSGRQAQWRSASLTITTRAPAATTLAFQPAQGDLFASVPVDGTYPDYERVVPTGIPEFGTFSFKREQLQKAVNALVGFAAGYSGKNQRATIRFAFNTGDHQALLSYAPEGEGGPRAEFAIECEHGGSARVPIDVGFDGRYIADFLRATHSDPKTSLGVDFRYYSADGPNTWLSVGGDAIEVIMPSRFK